MVYMVYMVYTHRVYIGEMHEFTITGIIFGPKLVLSIRIERQLEIRFLIREFSPKVERHV